MSKHHQQKKTRPMTNRVSTAMSVGSEMASSLPQQDFLPVYEDIQRRANQIHEEKGGSDLENWLEAERLLKEEHQRGR